MHCSLLDLIKFSLFLIKKKLRFWICWSSKWFLFFPRPKRHFVWFWFIAVLIYMFAKTLEPMICIYLYVLLLFFQSLKWDTNYFDSGQNYFGCFFALPIVFSSMRWGIVAGRKTMVCYYLKANILKYLSLYLIDIIFPSWQVATATLLLVLSGPVKALTYLVSMVWISNSRLLLEITFYYYSRHTLVIWCLFYISL